MIIIGGIIVLVGIYSATIQKFFEYLSYVICYVPIEFRYLIAFIIINLIFKVTLKWRL